MVYVVSDELCHHGIKGQKWGIRRYQNADGSLTAEGQKHYGSQGEKVTNRALKKGVSSGTAKALGEAVAKRNAQYEKTQNSAQRVDNAFLLSPKRWKEWHADAKQLSKDNKAVKELKKTAKTESVRSKLENKASSKALRRGASPETSQRLGKAYADRAFANQKYNRDWDRAYNSWSSFGKRRKERVDKLMESLNDYWIADDIYQRAKLDANLEIRKANGWR